MRKSIAIAGLLFFSFSCIPVRVAPSIKDYKVTKGKRFKRSLSKRNFFIFEDPKEANEFYNYVNTKFQLNHVNVYDDVPFTIDGQNYFFAFYEISIPNKTLNLAPALFNVAMNRLLDTEDDTYIDGQDMLRKDDWYIAIEVYSDAEKDCLSEDSLSRDSVLAYLRGLKNEYLTIHNYHETVFRN
ncbi:hypothetical protein [Pseudozobellia thermophila]|uniref:Uncharacterized protein n=1 Tax=Pseudozobellia thermophila TaxID=192903 RepID=A0A1M6BJI2_9FLAO|nr:hypothetical protein [Pseudozobellia thermophila]SHI48892.1 hypothetical protein SAMN04488513_101445 [Pseudozobellia thermophila]